MRGAALTPGVDDCRVQKLHTVLDHRGAITVVEGGQDVDFEFRRAYWTYDVPGGASRAGHAHRRLRQLYVAVAGSFEVLLDDGRQQRVVPLGHPDVGLVIVPGIWREVRQFSPGACLMVLASEHYDEGDYIRLHTVFRQWVAAGRPDGAFGQHSVDLAAR